jgi:hypothetical protein
MEYKITTLSCIEKTLRIIEKINSVYLSASSEFPGVTKKLLSAVVFLFLPITIFSQNIDLEKKAQEITEEGKYLYRLETAAWYGSDIFMENFKERESIGGYFSYIDKDTPKCLFFSKGENPKVSGVVSFGDIKVVETATIDFKQRGFKENEKHLYAIRRKALTEIQQDTILFKTYAHASLNLIPVIRNGEKKVYVLTGPNVTGVVLFGNDYLMTFDEQDNLKEKIEIHRNLIPVEFEKGRNTVGAMHSHLSETSDFITPTDICTLMLYAEFAGWKLHIVMSRKYVSIWNCDTETLSLMTRDDYNRLEEESKR